MATQTASLASIEASLREKNPEKYAFTKKGQANLKKDAARIFESRMKTGPFKPQPYAYKEAEDEGENAPYSPVKAMNGLQSEFTIPSDFEPKTPSFQRLINYLASVSGLFDYFCKAIEHALHNLGQKTYTNPEGKKITMIREIRPMQYIPWDREVTVNDGKNVYTATIADFVNGKLEGFDVKRTQEFACAFDHNLKQNTYAKYGVGILNIAGARVKGSKENWMQSFLNQEAIDITAREKPLFLVMLPSGVFNSRKATFEKSDGTVVNNRNYLGDLIAPRKGQLVIPQNIISDMAETRKAEWEKRQAIRASEKHVEAKSKTTDNVWGRRAAPSAGERMPFFEEGKEPGDDAVDTEEFVTVGSRKSGVHSMLSTAPRVRAASDASDEEEGEMAKEVDDEEFARRAWQRSPAGKAEAKRVAAAQAAAAQAAAAQAAAAQAVAEAERMANRMNWTATAARGKRVPAGAGSR
jgi:hypothetical protein